MKIWRLLVAGVGVIALVGCAPAPQSLSATPAARASSATDDSALTRTDAQGAVSVAVTPLSLDLASATLDFTVALSTHSVDLSWDLASQATLSTDTGLQVAGASWPVSSGHHVEGTLSFPPRTADGRALLEGARTLTLTLRDTDVAARTFVWDLAP